MRLNCLKCTLLFVLFFSMFSSIYSYGFHYPYEIWNGTFSSGKFFFQDDLEISGSLCLQGDCINSWPGGVAGDITAVNIGSGILGGGESGDVVLSLDFTYLDSLFVSETEINLSTYQRRVSSTCPVGSSIRVINLDGSVICENDTDSKLNEAEVDAFVNNNGYSAGAHTVNTNTNAGTICSAGEFLNGDGSCNALSTGGHTVDTNTQLNEGQVDTFVSNNGYSTGDHTVNTNTNAGTICSAGEFLNGDGSCDAVVVDTNTQLNEGQVDTFVSNNGYSTGAHTVNTNTNAGTICSVGEFLSGDGSCDAVVVDTNTQLNEGQVDTFVSNNGYSTGAHTVNTNTNAGTICSAGEFLNGDGSCDAVVVDTNSGGDITGVTAGTGLSGGGNSGAVTLNVQDNYVLNTGDSVAGVLKVSTSLDNAGDVTPAPGVWSQEITAGTATVAIGQNNGDASIQAMGSGTAYNLHLNPVAGSVYIGSSKAATETWVTGLGYSTSTGDITGVTAGTGLFGGGNSGAVTLNVQDNYVLNTGDTLSGQYIFSDTQGIQWEGGINRITHNDGGGNVQIRFGNDYSSSDERFTHAGTGMYIGGDIDSTTAGTLSLKVASNPGAGTGVAVVWGSALDITKSTIKYGGAELATQSWVSGQSYSTGSHTVNTNTQLNEGQVDTFVSNNGYSTGAHTVDTDTNTNAGTICSAGQYLDGAGVCRSMYGTLSARTSTGDNGWIDDLSATPRSMHSFGISSGMVGSANQGAPVSYGVLLNVPSYSSGQDGGAGQILFPYDLSYSSNGNPMFRSGDYDNSGWSVWKTFMDKTWADSLYLGKTAKAADANLLDGIDSSAFSQGAHTVNTNTNAGTICANGLFLNGDGSCDSLSNNPGDITGVTAGNGLTGGGSSGTPTLNVAVGTGLSVAANSVSLNVGYTDGRYLGISAKSADSNLLDGFNLDSANVPSTVAKRDVNGDISARLFRSEYATTNSNIGYIMTQIDLGSNNYLRPTLPSQFRTSVTDAYYLGISAKSSDSNLLDGIDSGAFLRSNADDTFSGKLISSSRNNGIFGTYDSTKTDQIWSMGSAYMNHASGTNFGNLYGLAYKHTNNPTGGTMAGGHQMVWAANGIPQSAMGSNIWTSGNYYGVAYYYNSDENLKNNIKTLNSSLDKIMSLRGVNFNWIGDNLSVLQVGLIAQEVELVYPELVDTNTEGLKSVQYGNLVAPLIEAVKEQQSMIENQQIQIDELKMEIEKLKNE